MICKWLDSKFLGKCKLSSDCAVENASGHAQKLKRKNYLEAMSCSDKWQQTKEMAEKSLQCCWSDSNTTPTPSRFCTASYKARLCWGQQKEGFKHRQCCFEKIYAWAAGDSWNLMTSDTAQGNLNVQLISCPFPEYKCPPGKVLALNDALWLYVSRRVILIFFTSSRKWCRNNAQNCFYLHRWSLLPSL